MIGSRRRERNKIRNSRIMTKKESLVAGLATLTAIFVDLLIGLCTICILASTIVKPGSWWNRVSGNSMSPTLHNGQVIFTDTGVPTRGDIVLIDASVADGVSGAQTDVSAFVKRIVGLPGDSIQITENGVEIDGVLYEEPYLTEEAREKTDCGILNSFRLGPGEYLVLGDNRGDSMDSRHFGAVSESDILYIQSATPTENFWVKTGFLAILVVINLLFYYAMSYGMMRLAEKIFKFPKYALY